MSLPSFAQNADAPILDHNVIDAFLAWYGPGLDLSDPTALPVTLAPANAADLSGLPPAYISVALVVPAAAEAMNQGWQRCGRHCTSVPHLLASSCQLANDYHFDTTTHRCAATRDAWRAQSVHGDLGSHRSGSP